MKLCRIGESNKEKPAIIDKENKYRDLSSIVKDFNLHKISTGQLLRDEVRTKTDLGKKIQPIFVDRIQDGSGLD